MKQENAERAWTVYFASLVSMERHPGKTKDGNKALSIQQLAHLADAMLLEHYERWDKD